MSPVLAGVALIVIAGAWMLLPLLPTLREFRQKTDDQPFEIIQENPFNPAHFADAFAERVRELRHEIETCRMSGAGAKGNFDDGEPYQIVARAEDISAVTSTVAEDSILIICAPGSIPNPVRFSKEVYATGDLSCAVATVFPAIFCEGALHLGPETRVLRWAHSQSHLNVGNGSILRGRLTSDGTMRLGRGTRFERLHARRIDFGELAFVAPAHHPLFLKRNKEENAEPVHKRRIIQGDLEISAGSVWTGDSVVKGKTVVAAGSLVLGSLKSYQDTYIGPGAVVQGSIVSVRNLELGEECAVLGPVISEGRALLRSGCHIGTEQRPTTLTARNIDVAPSAVVFGTVWARENGHVDG